MIQLKDSKSKLYSSDFLLRYLNSYHDFINADIEFTSIERSDFTCQLFEIWKLLTMSLNKKKDI